MTYVERKLIVDVGGYKFQYAWHEVGYQDIPLEIFNCKSDSLDFFDLQSDHSSIVFRVLDLNLRITLFISMLLD